MKSQAKIKSIIFLATIALVALFAIVVTQLIFINKTRKELNLEKQQLQELNKKLDYYENKYPNDEGFDIVI